MKRRVCTPAPEDSNGPHHLAPLESNVFAKLHSLVAHCAVSRYDDGSPRKPGWFTIKSMGSSWCVQVKDPDSCQSLQAIGATLDDALVLAALLLEAESGPWEPDPYLRQQAAKNPKR